MYRIVKIAEWIDHLKLPRRKAVAVLEQGAAFQAEKPIKESQWPVLYEKKDDALDHARKLNLAEKSYDVSWEIEEIK